MAINTRYPWLWAVTCGAQSHMEQRTQRPITAPPQSEQVASTNVSQAHDARMQSGEDGVARWWSDLSARRCYELAAFKGHAKAKRRLIALGDGLPPVPPVRH